MNQSPNTVETTRTYYNSDDADAFYGTVWGGEDIHIGLYDPPESSIFEASRRTVARMTDKIADRLPGARVIDLGAGYGGAARYLAAQQPDCTIDCLNLSEVQNARNRALNEQEKLSDRICVMDGSFEDVPADNATYDLVWSQDSILHSGDRPRVLQEVARVLKPGGAFIFTDPMQRDGVQPDDIRPVLERIHLATMASIPFYRQQLSAAGFEEIEVEELTPHLVQHYSRVRQEILAREDELEKVCSREYIDRMKAGLQHWVDAGKAGNLQWGIMLFKR